MSSRDNRQACKPDFVLGEFFLGNVDLLRGGLGACSHLPALKIFFKFLSSKTASGGIWRKFEMTLVVMLHAAFRGTTVLP